MWNKIFKKKQSKPSNKSQTDASQQTSTPTIKCFSFRNDRQRNGEQYAPSENNFQYFQHESEIYRKPGERIRFVSTQNIEVNGLIKG